MTDTPEQPSTTNLGIVTLSNGRRIVLREPMFEEIVELLSAQKMTKYTIAALCASMDENELRRLPFTDGLAIEEASQKVRTAIVDYIARNFTNVENDRKVS